MNANSLMVGLLLLAAAGPASAAAAAETVAPLVHQALPGAPGKQFTAAEVTFPPGARATAHRHGRAFLYAYVLEGDVRSQIEGEPAHIYHAGEGWTEQPGAHHLITENSSATAQARLLVTFVSEVGAPLKIEDPH